MERIYTWNQVGYWISLLILDYMTSISEDTLVSHRQLELFYEKDTVFCYSLVLCKHLVTECK